MLARIERVERVPETLEEVLLFLTRFGNPMVGVYSIGGGWHCSVEMHVSAKGATFDIKSDFKLPTPLDAAKQCAERVIQALRDLGAA